MDKLGFRVEFRMGDPMECAIIERDNMANVLRKLQTEVFVFNLRSPRAAPPLLPGFKATMTDPVTVEVELSIGQSLNEIFAQLSSQGIEVASMRNKVNRLEELFIRLVDSDKSAPAPVSATAPEEIPATAFNP